MDRKVITWASTWRNKRIKKVQYKVWEVKIKMNKKDKKF